MSETLSITCRACHGSGVITVAHRSCDPQLETVGPCQVQGCVDGQVEVEGHEIDEALNALHFLMYTAQGATGVTAGAVNRAIRAMQAIPGALS